MVHMNMNHKYISDIMPLSKTKSPPINRPTGITVIYQNLFSPDRFIIAGKSL